MHTVDTDAHVTVVTIVETVETHEDSRDERMCRIPVRPPRARSLRSGVTPLTFGGVLAFTRPGMHNPMQIAAVRLHLSAQLM